MNQFSQQPSSFQGQNNFQRQQFEPSGFVQSHYQGQLSQPTFGQQTNSIVGGIGNSGFQQGQQQFNNAQQQQHYAPISQSFGQQQSAASSNNYASHAPVQSHASSPATAFGNVGPVIAHTGYQASTLANSNNQQQSFNQASLYQPSGNAGFQQQSNFGQSQRAGFNQGQQHAQSYGMTQAHSQTSQNPVYQATHAYEQAGPVIAHTGGWQANSQQQNGYNGGLR